LKTTSVILRGVTKPVSWLSLLRTARAPLTVVALAAIALVLPPQSSDMLAAIGDDMHIVGFYAALALLTFSGWYWTRALIAARFDVPHSATGLQALQQADSRIDPYAYDAVPWIVFFLTFLLGLGLVARSSVWLAGLPLLVWLGLFIYYRPGRHVAGARSPRRIEFGTDRHYGSLSGGRTQPTNKLRAWWRGLVTRFVLLVERAPGGAPASATFIGIALLLFVWGAWASFFTFPDAYVSLPIAIATFFHGPAAALFVAALIIAPLSVLTFLADGYKIEFTLGGRTTGPARPPVILALAIWIAVAPWLFHLHTVRVGETVAARQPLAAMFQQWTAACAPGTGPGAPPVQPIIVAVSGGASRAAVWGARILQEAEDVSGPNRAVFAVSSVSGGSLGAAAYMALLSGLLPEELCANGTVTDMRKRRANFLADEPLGHDALGPVLAGALAVDIPRNLLSPFAALARMASVGQPRGGDRAEAMERGFEVLGQQADKVVQEGGGATPLRAPYLLLFYRDLAPMNEPPKGKYSAGMPLWIANGTDNSTGARLLTVPFKPETGWPFAAAGDVLSILKGDVPISTAIDNTSRFPFLEPSGELLAYWPDGDKSRSLKDRFCDQVRFCGRGSTEIIDGGYFENEGLLAALELARWLKTEGSKALGGRAVQPIIIQATATGAPDITPAQVVRFGSPPDDPTAPHFAPAPLEILAPLVGLNAARGGHAAVLLRQARDELGERFFHFYLPGENGKEVPLNWVLSDATTKFIRGAIDEDKLSGNKTERQRLHGLK
jgi:hypothetical protein